MSDANKNIKKERVIVYVDGFNLYFGMKEAGYEKCKWLDIDKLVSNLLKPNQEIQRIKYFTSRVGNNPEKQKRQTTYIEALETKGIQIFYGHYQSDRIECKRCGKRVFVVFPPKRHNSSVSLAAKGSLMIGRKKLVDSQFPSEVQKRDGYILRKPSDWI